jgi:hypothetical protein
MTALLLSTLAAFAHQSIDTDDDGWADKAEVDCGEYFVTDPRSFPGAREICDGLDNDCDCPEDPETKERIESDECVDEDGACVDDVMPCYQVEAQGQPAVDGDPCLLASNPDPSGCAEAVTPSSSSVCSRSGGAGRSAHAAGTSTPTDNVVTPSGVVP